jgi:hypothetical protein
LRLAKWHQLQLWSRKTRSNENSPARPLCSSLRHGRGTFWIALNPHSLRSLQLDFGFAGLLFFYTRIAHNPSTDERQVAVITLGRSVDLRSHTQQMLPTACLTEEGLLGHLESSSPLTRGVALQQATEEVDINELNPRMQSHVYTGAQNAFRESLPIQPVGLDPQHKQIIDHVFDDSTKPENAFAPGNALSIWRETEADHNR